MLVYWRINFIDFLLVSIQLVNVTHTPDSVKDHRHNKDYWIRNVLLQCPLYRKSPKTVTRMVTEAEAEIHGRCHMYTEIGTSKFVVTYQIKY